MNKLQICVLPMFLIFLFIACRSTVPKESSSVGVESFFDTAVVQDIVLNIEESDRQAMLDALPERIYVPATFIWGDIQLENVGVRFKGNSSSNPPAT